MIIGIRQKLTLNFYSVWGLAQFIKCCNFCST